MRFLPLTMRLCSALVTFLVGLPACAHDLWIERNGDLHALAYGHERSGHEGEKKLEYKPDSVKQALCLNGDGQEIKAGKTLTYPVTLKGNCSASWFLTSSGYWSKTPYGTRNLPKTEAGAVIDSWLSIEGVKRIDQWDDGLSRPLTQELELVPRGNPLLLKTGDKLHLRAFYQGRPVAGVTVAYFGKPRGITDKEGNVNIRLQSAGFQLIQASIELPLNDGKADKAVHAASLQFELK
jgi:nickel transport protein